MSWVNLVSWIKIVSKSSFEKNWILWDNSDETSQVVEVDFRNIYSIDGNFSREKLNNSTNRDTDCALSRSSSSNNTNFLLWIDSEGEFIKYNLSVWSVFQINVLELDQTLFWPFWSIVNFPLGIILLNNFS